MNPIEKHRLINEIALALINNGNKDIGNILNDYGIKTQFSKFDNRESIKNALTYANETSLISLAIHLKIKKVYTEEEKQVTVPALKKIFISHSVKDVAIVEDFITLLLAMGISDDVIFCSSIQGYGIPLGTNFLEEIKNRLNDDVLILFMLSDNFYKSPMCLCEMGAAWVKTKDHIPVVLPPFPLSEMVGVFRNSQGITVNNNDDINLLKETIENKFQLTPRSLTRWSRQSERILKVINQQIEQSQS